MENALILDEHGKRYFSSIPARPNVKTSVYYPRNSIGIHYKRGRYPANERALARKTIHTEGGMFSSEKQKTDADAPVVPLLHPVVE